MAADNGYSKQEQQDRLIAALRRERAGYAAANKTERIAAVDAELERLGAKSEDDTRDARKQAPQGRSAKPQSTD
jgi:hypothetical protein